MQKRKHFIRKKEDFVCRFCGEFVYGTGYTNHCSNCLYSLHVDEEVPGDRASSCKGLMKPVKIEIRKGDYIVIHECSKCGKTTRNKTSSEDNFKEILRLVRG